MQPSVARAQNFAGVHPDVANLLERSASPVLWVADEPFPGLSVRRCIERLRDT